MRIYLFLPNKIEVYNLPKEITGSYSFDPNTNESSKIINIEAKDNKWFLYSTLESTIVDNNKSQLKEVALQENNYYFLHKNNNYYLIYIISSFDNTFKLFAYNQNTNLIIGNKEECNIRYNCPYINQDIINIKFNNEIVLTQTSNIIYLNKKKTNKTEVVINYGENINIYGLQIIVFKDLLLINNPYNNIFINESGALIKSFNLPQEEAIDEKVERIYPENLYKQEEYFSKAPRLRRTIESAIFELSSAPKDTETEEKSTFLTIGPMLTMGLSSLVMIANTTQKIISGESDISKVWPTFIISATMLSSMIMWPLLIRRYQAKKAKDKKEDIFKKYNKYLELKKEELIEISKNQKQILTENLIPVEDCLRIIERKDFNFWGKRIEQNDFLETRIGIGTEKLKLTIEYPKEGFTIEENKLKEKADKLIEEYKYITNVPVGYSFYQNMITAIMSVDKKNIYLMNNILLQLLTFYSYEDLKIVVLTSQENAHNWEYLKYSNHNFSNDKTIRFFARTNDDYKILDEYFKNELSEKLESIKLSEDYSLKPYYFVIIDDYSKAKHLNFITIVTETDKNLGYSIVIMGNKLSNLPSKCNNFISLGNKTSGILKNSYEKQEELGFIDEINYKINMYDVVKKISNTPIELDATSSLLPESLNFLELEKVGKVKQLNIINRWNTNDSTQSLKAEIGIDEAGEIMYLDLHEKAHGPHGLIAGMTGSGKSEFIITYILSMAINYSPDDVSFILIDYKGGGLAGAFENRTKGIILPHLAGTITNLDKAEMNRTLVSIDSEVKRRQEKFNEARDNLGESTIDIYKYQKYYHEGKLTDPIPHLFIVCDEFAELKSQQPEFMDNLISIARIGRSLGVHLILATQKPSGVVNDQIWSNSKFHICLKVQDESDSKEMLKKPDAARLKQTGRFYMQVGFDEYFALGQAAWAGAKYYPSDKIIKQKDKSIDFINDTGVKIKSLSESIKIKINAEGEQITAIMKNIIEEAQRVNKKTKRLWLENLSNTITVDELLVKYQKQKEAFKVQAIIGEYDAPENQEQGLLEYSLQANANTIVIGNDEAEKEKLLTTILYSICTRYVPEEINLYIVDYGSESLRMFERFPQNGGMVFVGEDEKLNNLLKLITKEIEKRKKALIPYGGNLDLYNIKNQTKLNKILLILNNFEAITEIYPNMIELLIPIARECDRYGINILITASLSTTIGRRLNQSFPNNYALHVGDETEYYNIFNGRVKVKPRDIFGRGLTYNNGIHEFQTAAIVKETENIVEFINTRAEQVLSQINTKAKPIPSLPEQITYEHIKNYISTLSEVPIGIFAESLEVLKYNFKTFTTTTIASNKLININNFMISLLKVLLNIKDIQIFFIDVNKELEKASQEKLTYISEEFKDVLPKLITLETAAKQNPITYIYVFYGVEKIINKDVDINKLKELMTLIKKNDKSKCIFADSNKGLRATEIQGWYSENKNNSDGIWIGSGISDQLVFRVNSITKAMSKKYDNNYGYYISENNPELIKLIEFDSINLEGEDNE